MCKTICWSICLSKSSWLSLMLNQPLDKFIAKLDRMFTKSQDNKYVSPKNSIILSKINKQGKPITSHYKVLLLTPTLRSPTTLSKDCKMIFTSLSCRRKSFWVQKWRIAYQISTMPNLSLKRESKLPWTSNLVMSPQWSMSRDSFSTHSLQPSKIWLA